MPRSTSHALGRRLERFWTSLVLAALGSVVVPGFLCVHAAWQMTIGVWFARQRIREKLGIREFSNEIRLTTNALTQLEPVDAGTDGNPSIPGDIGLRKAIERMTALLAYEIGLLARSLEHEPRRALSSLWVARKTQILQIKRQFLRLLAEHRRTEPISPTGDGTLEILRVFGAHSFARRTLAGAHLVALDGWLWGFLRQIIFWSLRLWVAVAVGTLKLTRIWPCRIAIGTGLRIPQIVAGSAFVGFLSLVFWCGVQMDEALKSQRVPVPTATGRIDTNMALAIFDQINLRRRGHGLEPWPFQETLQAKASQRALELATNCPAIPPLFMHTVMTNLSSMFRPSQPWRSEPFPGNPRSWLFSVPTLCDPRDSISNIVTVNVPTSYCTSPDWSPGAVGFAVAEMQSGNEAGFLVTAAAHDVPPLADADTLPGDRSVMHSLVCPACTNRFAVALNPRGRQSLEFECPHCDVIGAAFGLDESLTYRRPQWFFQGFIPTNQAQISNPWLIWAHVRTRLKYAYPNIIDSKWHRPERTYASGGGICIDVAILLADWISAARGEHVDARVAVGHTSSDPAAMLSESARRKKRWDEDELAPWGHAWVVAADRETGHEYLLEATEGPIRTRVPPRTSIVGAGLYLPQYQFNRNAVWSFRKPRTWTDRYLDGSLWATQHVANAR